ncbi:hypothetical protein [Thermodesulfitimonas autotrophica]|uniref:hypothetical protein n=1 Tax=Thermodesulfitimonas autotrophica TaxID=1894989 RepID=UPI002FDF0CF0
MKKAVKKIVILLLLSFSLPLASGCGKGDQVSSGSAVPGRPEAAVVSVREIKDNPASFKDKPVQIRGYGVIVAIVPLGPGYVGIDTRYRFVDAAKDTIVAKVADGLLKSGGVVFEEKNPRLFRGYVRIFSGQIGYPGQLRRETFPYLEIVAVE